MVLFILLNMVNVVIQTIKSITTVKCGKLIASITNALAYGFYTIVVVYMVDDSLSLWQRVLIVGLANLVGVFVVKAMEEKARKDKLWLVKVTVPSVNSIATKEKLRVAEISNSMLPIDNFTVFDCYCKTQAETQKVLDICKMYNGKAFATENKLF